MIWLLLACGPRNTPAPAAEAAAVAPTSSPPMAPATESGIAELHQLLTDLGRENRWQGGLVLARDGQVFFEHHEGTRFAGGGPIGPDTRLRIGSISKVFTSVVVHQLVAEGRLSLDATLAAWFPKLPNADRITIEQLLDHHSGLHSFTDDPDYTLWMEQETPREALLERMSAPVGFEPGEKGAYSNTNYVLLGWIVEAVTGQDLASCIAERITGPLGMTRTLVGDGIDPADDEARSQTWAGVAWKDATETHPSVPGGAGAVVSTPTDLCRFGRALFDGELLDSDGLASMQTLDDAYGRGLFRFPFHDRWSWGHTGGIDGFSSMLGYFPDDGSCIAIVTHGNNLLTRDQNQLAIDALTVANGGRVKDRAVEPVLVLTTDQLRPFVGTYTSKDVPLTLTLFLEHGVLMGQVEGQQAFPLTARTPNELLYAGAGVRLVFDGTDRFTLFQGGKVRFVRSDGGAQPVE